MQENTGQVRLQGLGPFYHRFAGWRCHIMGLMVKELGMASFYDIRQYGYLKVEQGVLQFFHKHPSSLKCSTNRLIRRKSLSQTGAAWVLTACRSPCASGDTPGSPGFPRWLLYLQQDGCFTGQSGHGGLKLIISIINCKRRPAPELLSICRKRLD